MVELKPKQKVQAEIIRITGEGKGVAYTDEEKLILIDGINEDDRVVRIEITNVFEETIFAKKISNIKTDKKSISGPDVVDSPYDLDDDEDYDDENEDY